MGFDANPLPITIQSKEEEKYKLTGLFLRWSEWKDRLGFSFKFEDFLLAIKLGKSA